MHRFKYVLLAGIVSICLLLGACSTYRLSNGETRTRVSPELESAANRLAYDPAMYINGYPIYLFGHHPGKGSGKPWFGNGSDAQPDMSTIQKLPDGTYRAEVLSGTGTNTRGDPRVYYYSERSDSTPPVHPKGICRSPDPNFTCEIQDGQKVYRRK